MTDDLLHTRPKRRAGLSLREGSTGFEVVDETGTTVAAINDTAVALWRVCDGDATLAEIIQAAAQIFDAPESVIQADMTSAIEDFRVRGLLEDERAERI